MGHHVGRPMLWIDLQLFAGEKTEKATPRKRQEARKRGQVLRSNEVNSALILLFTFMVLRFYFPYMWEAMEGFTRSFLLEETNGNLTPASVQVMFLKAMWLMTQITLPIVGAAVIAGLLANYIQVGFLFSAEVIQVRLDRLNPIEGLRRIFSKRALVELVKAIWKIVAIGYVMYLTLADNFATFPQLMDMELESIIMFVNHLVYNLAWRVGLLLLTLAGFDYLYQWWEYEESLKMSKQELKDEYKQTEGDPQLRARIRQKQREMAMRRMMSEIPKADVVITNPTHFAVALKYESQSMEAPVVVAKGQDFIAQRIKAIARENQVTIVENPPLAQAIYRGAEIGQAVPPELYQAVAEVLAFVYRLRKKAW